MNGLGCFFSFLNSIILNCMEPSICTSLIVQRETESKTTKTTTTKN